jgi:hypothetical protein
MTSARNLSIGVYAIDFLFCSLVYPPCDGGFGQLMFIIMSGQLGRLDLANIAILIVTLFAVEAIVRFIFWLGQITYFMKAAHSR